MVNDRGGIAFLFPGQGAQYVGMGKDLYENCPEARDVFDEAKTVLGFDLGAMMFEGPVETLTQTANSQPAILTMSYAAYEALRVRARGVKPRAVAGLSLGEYTALITAGSLSFEDGLRLVRKRGEFMEQACRDHPGTMASVIGLSLEAVKSICAAVGEWGIVDVANVNSPGQMVISGEKEAVEKAAELAREQGSKRVIELNVSGAFHSRLMEDAQRRLCSEIRRTEISAATIPVVANVTARAETQPDEIRENLGRQVTGTVLWQQSIEHLESLGVDTFVEVGCGKVLQGLVKRTCPQAKRAGVEDTASLENTLSILQEETGRE
jgi:[acyl-carrier-protein] S-malonyltransferase